MNICFTIKDNDKALIDKFINAAESEEHGWLDVRGHPMSTKTNYDDNTNSIRVTIYNPQREEAIDKGLADRFGSLQTLLRELDSGLEEIN